MAQFYADRVAIGSHRAKTPEGYLVCLGIPFARTGFQTYKASDLDLKGDGEVEVYRRFDEVFNPSTLASFEGKSVTSPHPPKFLNPDNDSEYSIGHIQNVRQGPLLADGEHALLGDLVIKDSRIITKIESNTLTELSAGYECEYVPDEHNPKVYYQMGIRGNHVAVVPKGRAGSSVKILDSATEEESMAETVIPPVVDDKVSVGALTGLLRLLGWGGQKTTDSSDPDGAVERNERMNAEALRRAKVRNNDDDKKKGRDEDPEEEELEREEAGAKKPKEGKDKKKSKDDDDDDKKKMTDAFNRLADAIEKLGEKEKKKEEEDDDDKKQEKDADLIPVETLSKGERPHNPIPGADSIDSKRALDCVLGLRSLVADSGDAATKALFNDAVRALKGKKPTSDKYGDLSQPRKPDGVRAAEDMSRVRTSDQAEVCNDFVETARQYHRRNPGEVAAERSAAGKEKK